MPGSAQLYGKLPAHGDFVARGLSAAARDGLDAWLSTAMTTSRTSLGAEFDARFDAALPWRCVGPGSVGAIAASQDAVGRRFPVVLLAAGDDAAACEALLYAAIGGGWNADALVAAAGVGPPAPPEQWVGPAGTRTGAMPADLIAAMLGEGAAA